MKIDQFPEEIHPYLIPEHRGRMVYECLGCKGQFDTDRLLYVCPSCRDVLLIRDLNFERLTAIGGDTWRKTFDYRKMLNEQALKGIFRYYEFMAPVIPLEDILYLGEGDTPLVAANGPLKAVVGLDFYFKNEGLNPSASFKDRGMACLRSELPECLCQGEEVKGSGGGLCVNGRYIRRSGPLRRLHGQCYKIRGPFAPRKDNPAAVGTAPGERSHGPPDSRPL
jgi:threonine synthase